MMVAIIAVLVSSNMTEESAYKRAYERQKVAREKAEQLLETRSRELYESNTVLSKYNKELITQKAIAERLQQQAAGELGMMVGGNIGRQYLFGGKGIADNFGKATSEGLKSSFSFGNKAPTFEGFTPKVGYGYGIGRFAGGLLAGEDFKDAAKSGVKSGVGAAVGSIFGPVGSFIGGSIGGRVICNELQRQGVMSRQNVLLDYRFTRDYLTPQHVNGYHVWAVHVVKQMRKGRGVKLWRHLAQHRANEIAYIYGKRDKPDYLGKIYRKILEPICWSVGFFCEKTDWSVLYKTKEI